MNMVTINPESVCDKLQAMSKKMVDYNIGKIIKNQENPKLNLDDLSKDDELGIFEVIRSKGMK